MKEIQTADEQITSLAGVPDELKEAEEREHELLESVASTSQQQNEIRRLEDELAILGVRADYLQRVGAKIDEFSERIGRMAAPAALEAWPQSGGPADLLAGVRAKWSSAVRSLERRRRS